MASTPLVDPVREEPGRHGRWRRFRGWLSRVWHGMQPGPRARKGASWGAAGAALMAAALTGSQLQPGLGPVLDVPAGILIGLIMAGIAGLVLVLIVKLLGLLYRFLGWTGLAAVGVFLLILMTAFLLPGKTVALASLGLVVAAAVFGGGLAVLLGGDRPRPAKRIALIVAAVASLAVYGVLIGWLVDRGSTEHLVKVKRPDPVRIAPLAAADPSRPGPFRVRTLTYGSGTDRWRPEFGEKAGLKTKPVDGTPFLEGNEGWGMKLRTWYWGFGSDKLPLNGRVWYPEGPGPFPLVLVVHGNHNMGESSDPGYGWLGELLASRGFITVSVDENFLNGTWWGGLETENDARGWLLLQHLKAWRGWSRTPGNPFHRKVDLDRIGLIGHSRGGEAVAIAASFNRLARYPDDAGVALGFNFGIRAVVAIAPADGQYKPAGKPTPLADVNYLVLQGGHDADVSSFMGERAYRRITFENGRYAFKAALFSYRSNHGQFNTVWGDADHGWPGSLALNREALLSAEEQRRLGSVYISAFLEATLHDETAYVRLFRDSRSARAWLPEDQYVTRFQDSTFRAVADYEEDVDVTTTALEGARIEGRRLAEWKEQDLPFRQGQGTKQNQVVRLGWKRDPKAPAQAGSYTVRLPQPLPADWTLGSRSLLIFSLADSGEEPPDPKEKDKKGEADKKAEEKKEKEREARKEREKKEGKEPLDLTVELVAADGQAVRLPLSRFRALPVPLEAHFTKLSEEGDTYGKAWEPVLQTFELPLAAFAEAHPGFDPAALRAVRLVFDRSPEGVVILDDLGFAEAR